MESNSLDEQISRVFAKSDSIDIPAKDYESKKIDSFLTVINEAVTDVVKLGNFSLSVSSVQNQITGLPDTITRIIKPIVYQILIKTFIQMEELGLPTEQIDTAKAAIRFALNNGEDMEALDQVNEAQVKFPLNTVGLKS